VEEMARDSSDADLPSRFFIAQSEVQTGGLGRPPKRHEKVVQTPAAMKTLQNIALPVG